MKLFVSGCCVLLEIYSLGNKSSAHFIFASKSRNGKFLNQMKNTFVLHKICLNNLVMWRNSAQLLLLPLSIDVFVYVLVICQAMSSSTQNLPFGRELFLSEIFFLSEIRSLWQIYFAHFGFLRDIFLRNVLLILLLRLFLGSFWFVAPPPSTWSKPHWGSSF